MAASTQATGQIASPRARDHTAPLREARRPSVEVVAQHLGATRVTQLAHRLGLDLPDPLAGDAVDLADLVQGARLAVGEPEAQLDYAGLALGQRLQHRL